MQGGFQVPGRPFSKSAQPRYGAKPPPQAPPLQDRNKKAFKSVFNKREEISEEAWPGMPKSAATRPKAKTPMVVPPPLVVKPSPKAPSIHTAPLDPLSTAPGAKIVPKTSSVALPSPARTSAEDIDKWDVDEEVELAPVSALSGLKSQEDWWAQDWWQRDSKKTEPRSGGLGSWPDAEQARESGGEVREAAAWWADPPEARAEEKAKVEVRRPKPKESPRRTTEKVEIAVQKAEKNDAKEVSTEKVKQKPFEDTNPLDLIIDVEAQSQAKEPSKEIKQKEVPKVPKAKVLSKEAKEPIKEPVKQPLKEPLKEPAKEPAKEAAKEAAKEPAKELTKALEVKKEPQRKVRPLPKPVATLSVDEPPEGAVSKLTPAKRPASRLPQPVEAQVERLKAREASEKPKSFDWSLLVKIDSLLLGCESNFFLHRQGDGSRLPGMEPEACESTGSEGDMESEESEEMEEEKILTGQGVEEELEEEEQEEDDIEEVDQEAQVKEAAATTRPKAQAAPPEPVKSTRPKPAPAPRREERASEQGSETAEEDLNDEEIRAALAAKLTPADEAPRAATRPKAKPKTWGAPPPLAEKPLEEPKEPRQAPKPFFDQWLASLKFIAGWNDQKKYEAAEVKEAFSQYLASEDIISKDTVEQLCRTIVPLLLDLERVDSMVVANLKKEVLRTLKIVQVCILRVVTFELLREHSAKMAKKGKSKKQEDGSTYLASDITSLAKVIQHFRFDQNFTKGVHQLIVAFRKKAEKPKAEKGSRKRAGASPDEAVPEEVKVAGEDAEKLEEKPAADENPVAEPAADEKPEEQPVDEKPRKKPRMVS